MVWFWLFVFYSFGGYLLEKAFAAATASPQQVRKCFLLLPLCPVYGFGVLAVLSLPESMTNITECMNKADARLYEDKKNKPSTVLR